MHFKNNLFSSGLADGRLFNNPEQDFGSQRLTSERAGGDKAAAPEPPEQKNTVQSESHDRLTEGKHKHEREEAWKRQSSVSKFSTFISAGPDRRDEDAAPPPAAAPLALFWTRADISRREPKKNAFPLSDN